jgi:hypothetical protein
VIGGGHAGINRLLQNDLLDVVGREAAFGQRGCELCRLGALYEIFYHR